MNTLYIFIDTNILLHYQKIEQIKWIEIFKVDSVTLVISPTVIRELDNHKDNHKINAIRDRARDALKTIKSIIKKTDLILPQGLKIECVNEPRINFIELNLSTDHPDDRLVASCIDFKTKNPKANVILVSHDVGPSIKAAQHGIQTEELPADYKLPSTLDEQEKEIRQLKSRLIKLENQSPKLTLGFLDKNQYLKIPIKPFYVMSNSEITKKMGDIKTNHPHLSMQNSKKSDATSIYDMFNSINKPSQEELERYNNSIEKYYADYEKYLGNFSTHENFNRLTMELKIILFNNGTSPAEDIDIFMHFPDGFNLFDEDSHPKTPNEPEPPSPPRSILDGINMFNHDRYFMPLNPIAHAPSNISSVKIKKGNSYDVTYRVKRLKQYMQAPCDTIFVNFDSHNTVNSFNIEYRINAGNLPEEATGKLHIVFEK